MLYSIIAFRRQAEFRHTSEGWSYQHIDDHITFCYKNVSFNGDCEYGSDGDGLNRRFVVKSVRIHLKEHPSKLNGWSKNDLYSIEENLYANFPESEIVWDEPMSTIIGEEK